MLSFFPRGVLDEILNLIESVSADFPSYFHTLQNRAQNQEIAPESRSDRMDRGRP